MTKNIAYIILLGISLLGTGCIYQNNPSGNPQNTSIQSNEDAIKLLVGDWSFDQFSLNQDEMAKLVRTTKDQRDWEEIQVSFAEMNKNFSHVVYKFYQDGTYKVIGGDQPQFGTYRVFGDGNYMDMEESNGRNNNPPTLDIALLNQSKLELSWRQLIPLEDGSGDKAEAIYTLGFKR